jgi:hypothetical protein
MKQQQSLLVFVVVGKSFKLFKVAPLEFSHFK